MKQKAVDIVYNSIPYDESQSSIVSEDSSSKLRHSEIRKMKKYQLETYCLENKIDDSGTVLELKKRLVDALRLHKSNKKTRT